MTTDFAIWLTDLESFKLGITFGALIGILIYFIICAVVEYAVNLLDKKITGDKHDKQS